MSYALAVLATIAGAVGLAARLEPRHRGLAAFVVGGFVLYAGGVLPGGFGRYTGGAVAASTAALGLLAFVVARLVPRTGAEPAAPATPASGGPEAGRGLRRAALAALALLAVFGLPPEAGPFGPSSPVGYAGRHLGHLFDDAAYRLHEDAAGYHLPRLIEYAQSRTLWWFEGPYASYAYGFELIFALPLLLYKSTFGLILGAVAAPAMLLLAAASLTTILLDGRVAGGWRHAAVGAAALLAWAFAGEALAMLGKNDVFAAACLLAALVFLLAALAEEGGSASGRLTLSAAALALALATKPTALGFLPAWAAGVALVAARRSVRLRAWPVMAACLGLGGFFLGRNLVHYGSLTGDLGFDPWPTTLAADPSPRTLGVLLDGSNALFPTALLAGGTALLGLAVRARPGRRVVCWVALGWFACGVLVFLLTPFSLFLGRVVQWRFALAPLVLGGIGIVVLAADVAGVGTGRPTPATGDGRTRRRARWAAAAVVLGLALAPAYVGRHDPRGLHGYERAQGRPTMVYRWVERQPGRLRVYAAGLYPGGLYGHDLRHRVRYRLGSAELSAWRGREHAWLADLRRRFDPHLIVVAADPFAWLDAPRRRSGGKPMADWLGRQPCVALGYADRTASAFRLDRACFRRLAPRRASPDAPPRVPPVP